MASAAERFWGTIDTVTWQRQDARRHVEAARKQAAVDPREFSSVRRREEILAAYETFTRLELADQLGGEGLTAFFADLVGGQPPTHVARQLAAFRKHLSQIGARSRNDADRALVQPWVERANKIEDLLASDELEQAQRLLDAAWAEVLTPRGPRASRRG